MDKSFDDGFAGFRAAPAPQRHQIDARWELPRIEVVSGSASR
jgi:hypothetical protein